MLMLGVLLLSLQLLAQTRTVTGRVTDANGAPLTGATVQIKNSRTGTVTKEDGTFSINVPANARTLVISAVGQAAQEVTIGNQTTLTVTLQAGSQQNMQEVIVTGYSRERRSQFAGSASTISPKAVEMVPVGSFDQALQGRAPGVLVNSGSGQPGSSPTITIRGVQSIAAAGAQPLYVLDGIPIPASDFATINPNDFESITVLKDASASALYGARGGTGVIVITTKKGRAGTTNITVRSQVGVTEPPNFSRLNMMNTAEILQYEEYMGLQGATTNTPGWIYSKKNPTYATLPAATQARYDFMLDSIRGINRNYAKDFYRTGLSQTHEVDLSGGTEKTRYYLSVGMFDQQGIAIRTGLKRYTTRFNLDHTVGNFSVQFNTTAGYSKTDFSEGDWLGNSPRNPFQMTFRAKPYENPYNPDGSLNYGASTTLALKQVANLLEGIHNTQYTQKQIKANSGLTVAYRVLPSLTLKNTFGIDVTTDLDQHYINPKSYYGSLQTFQAGEDREAYFVASQIINTSAAIFSKRFGIHEVEAGAYFETVQGWQKGLGFTLYNLDYRLPNTGQGAGTLPTNGAATYPQNASSANTGFGIRSYFATGRYTYNNKYTINANIRRDGTSRIVNEKNREITTWSAGAIWNAMQENFMKDQHILSDLRVRASYGIVPNIGSIVTSTYGINGGLIGVTNYQGPQVPSFGTTSYAGSSITGIAPTTPGNPDYRIEKIEKANIGVDFAVWHSRARFIIDAYKNKTVDLFVRQPLPGGSGFPNLDINAGVMSNKGIEATVTVDIVKTRDLDVTVGGNHSFNKNVIEDLGAVNEYFLGTFVIRKGLPYGTHYTTHYLGADPATGRPMFLSPDGKTVVYDAAQAGNFADFGSYLPKHVGSFNGSIRYKRFSVEALFTYQFDVVRSNNTRNWITRGTSGYQASVNGSRELLTNQWTKPGDNKFFQAPIYDRGFSSADLENARFLRFRNLMVSYSLPALKIKGTTIFKGGRIYAQGQNLAIWSPWTGMDPEDNNNISLNEYPNPKMYVGGIDINF
jgi:TonB-linked SusC/RagA family outer membrane protein